MARIESTAMRVTEAITTGDHVYDWRHLASIMQGVDFPFEMLRRQRAIDL